MQYQVIATGSGGNAVVLGRCILIDCGVSLAKIKAALQDDFRNIKIVLLTHQHTDHFHATTIRNLAAERPTLRFVCCHWLVQRLLDCGVSPDNIDCLTIGKSYDYGVFQVSPIKLYHDVDNCGWRIFLNGEKAIYMTDTSTLDGISARNYDLYLVEANYTEEEIARRIREKRQAGFYVYEYRALQTHLSKEQADEWLLENLGERSEIVYLHRHKEEEHD